MFALVLGMFVCIALAVSVLGAVVLPAHREGRELLTPHGEEVLGRVIDRTDAVTAAARERVEVVREHVALRH